MKGNLHDISENKESFKRFVLDYINLPEHNEIAFEKYRSYSVIICNEFFRSYFKGGKQKDTRLASKELFTFLASWGMVRGSSALLQRSPYVFEETINVLGDFILLFDIDLGKYTKNKDILIGVYDSLKKALKTDIGTCPSDTLITKIMSGVFGTIPAFDSNFKRALSISTISKGDNFFDVLSTIERFYNENKYVFEEIIISVSNDITYSNARIFDMYAFQKGIDLLS